MAINAFITYKENNIDILGNSENKKIHGFIQLGILNKFETKFKINQ